MKKKLKKGFTLVELVVVIAVIAVLAAVSVGAYFGVTDSANSSNATATLKQIKDLWMLYSVEEYENFSTAEERAQDFCLRYSEYQSIKEYLNYDIVDVKPRGSTQSLESDEANTNGILFKIETTYPTWFLVSDTYIIESSTDVLKNNTDFNNSFAC